MSRSWFVRVFGATDTAALRKMLAMFGDAFGDTETYISRQPDDTYLQSLLANSGFVAVAAFSAGRVIGGVASYVLPKFGQPRSELYIYDLAVEEAFRRQGVATAMINVLKGIATSTTAMNLRLRSIPEWEFAKTSCISTLNPQEGASKVTPGSVRHTLN